MTGKQIDAEGSAQQIISFGGMDGFPEPRLTSLPGSGQQGWRQGLMAVGRGTSKASGSETDLVLPSVGSSWWASVPSFILSTEMDSFSLWFQREAETGGSRALVNTATTTSMEKENSQQMRANPHSPLCLQKHASLC